MPGLSVSPPEKLGSSNFATGTVSALVMTPKRKRIAVMIETTRSFSRDLIKAVARESKKRPDWQLLLHEHHREQGVPAWLRSWRGDGLLVRIHDEELAEFLADAPYPVINIAGGCRHGGIPIIEPDEEIVIDSVLRFFLNRAFSNFAYCGYPGIWYSDLRERAFAKAIAARKLRFETYDAPAERVSNDMSQREEFNPEGSPELVDWLAGLPEHTAILACNDVRAFQQQISASAAQRSIPEDLAVVGVGNEAVVCELCNPTLSSVRLDADSIGRTACEWLDALMGGEVRPEDITKEIPPHSQSVPIIERASTDVIASNDPILVASLRFIRSQCHEPINAASVLDHVGKSRNTVESRLRTGIGRSIAEEILRCRIDRAKILIEHTTLTMEQISKACGFATAPHFTKRFKQATGQTPGAHRESW